MVTLSTLHHLNASTRTKQGVMCLLHAVLITGRIYTVCSTDCPEMFVFFGLKEIVFRNGGVRNPEEKSLNFAKKKKKSVPVP